MHLQHPDGYWCGELFVDATLCADYVAYMHWAGEVDPVLQEKCARTFAAGSFPTADGTFTKTARAS
jgi:hypothetical protein